MAYIIMAYIVMAVGILEEMEIVMAYIVMAVGILEEIVMGYIVMAVGTHPYPRMSKNICASTHARIARACTLT